MRSQTRWLQRVVGVFTLTTTLFSIPVTKSFAQASLYDPAFKVGGGANGRVFSIVVQDDGKIVVGGEFTQIAGQARTNLARLDSDGQLDGSFPQGTDGVVYRLLNQSDGKILVAGTFTNLQGVARQRIGRLLTNGLVDASFDAGTAIPSDLGVFALAVQIDQKVLAATISFNWPFYSQLKRFQPDGQLDLSFTQTNLFQDWHVFAISPLTNGSILVGGGFQHVNDDALPGLALLTTNGMRDINFSSRFNSSISQGSGVYAMLEQPDHSLLIGGKFWQRESTNRFAVAKLSANLEWDASFQPDVFDPVYGETTLGYVMSIVQQTDGKFVLGGLFQEVGGYWRRDIVRLDAQGKVDPCFEPGFGVGDLAGWGGVGVQVVARQPDGKILAGGDFVNFMGSPVAILSSSNLTRFLPQNDCNATRVYLGKEDSGQNYVIATCAPGGTNLLQVSTNLADWTAIDSISGNPTTSPYIHYEVPGFSMKEGGLFFRVKKEY